MKKKLNLQVFLLTLIVSVVYFAVAFQFDPLSGPQVIQQNHYQEASFLGQEAIQHPNPLEPADIITIDEDYIEPSHISKEIDKMSREIEAKVI